MTQFLIGLALAGFCLACLVAVERLVFGQGWDVVAKIADTSADVILAEMGPAGLLIPLAALLLLLALGALVVAPILWLVP